MAVKILLDTSAYVWFKKGVPEVIEAVTEADSIIFSPIVLGELMFGFRSGSRYRENVQTLRKFLEHETVEIVEIGLTTADRYSRIASDLKLRGTPIPTNDIWIAAQTMEHGAELIAVDRHFEKIPGLVCTLYGT